MVNSRSKGKRGELEIAHLLKARGYDARRGQQFSGIYGDADVIGLPGIHIEAKRVERLDLKAAYAQSIRDAREFEMPTVWHRKNNEQWMVTLSADDFLRLYERSFSIRDPEKTETGA